MATIYTRKSSEEGLEQGFNSLHAQREACEAYVLSQVGEGWTALPTLYDDGGYSGGSMDRPGLKQLLSDVERGLIDTVVVYRIDRLTRALSDFARIVEIFDDRGHPMSPSSARKDGRLNRHYVSAAVIRGDRGEPGSLPRIPADPAEALVDRELRQLVDPAKVDGDVNSALVRLVVSSGGVEITLDPAKLRIGAVRAEDPDAPVVLRIPMVLKTFGGAKHIVDGAGAPMQPLGPDLAFQKAIARGRRWAEQLTCGDRAGADDIAAVEDVPSRYVDKLVRLAWLAPDITEAILGGRRLRDYSLTELLEADIPMDWHKQRAALVVV